MNRGSTNSSLILSYGYDAQSQTLEVEFRSNGAVWQYAGVPYSVYQDLRSADSLGKAFLSMIKGQYEEKKVS